MTVRPATCTALLLALTMPPAAVAQGVLIAPHAVIVDHRTRSGSLTLYNPGTEPVEVEVSTIFGYPVADSTGRLTLRVDSMPGPDEPSAAPWIEAFPRRVTVAPLQRQVVRILARPPADLPDGEYWSRIVVAARGGAVPVEGQPAGADISVGLTLEVRTIISFNYRKGNVSTGLTMGRVQPSVRGDSVDVRLDLTRAGNAAWLGTAVVRLTDAQGAVRDSVRMPLAVYRRLEPLLTLSRAGLAPGTYRVSVDMVTERADIPNEELISAPTASGSAEVRVP